MTTGSVNTNAAGTISLDMYALLGQEGVDQIAAEVLQYFNATNTLERLTSDEPITVPGGSDPELPTPLLDPANVALILAALRDKIMSENVNTAQEEIQADADEKARMHAENIAKIEEFIDKMKDANKSGLVGKIFGWIGVVAMAIASVAVIVAGVATGNPALVAAGICLVVATAIMITMMADQETGGKINEAFTAAVAQSLMDNFGLSEDKAKMGAQIFAMVLVTVVIIALSAPSAVIGLAGVGGAAAGTAGTAASTAANASSTASTVASTASTAATATSAAANTASATATTVNTAVMTAAKIMQSIAHIAGGLAQVGQGSAGIASSVLTNEATLAQADSKEIQALIQQIKAQMEAEVERLQEMLEQINGTWEIVINIINNSADTASHISQSMTA